MDTPTLNARLRVTVVVVWLLIAGAGFLLPWEVAHLAALGSLLIAGFVLLPSITGSTTQEVSRRRR